MVGLLRIACTCRWPMHDTANNSSSMMTYRDSVSEMNLDPAWMSTQLSPILLLEDESKSLAAGVSAQSGWFVWVEVYMIV